jgi:hypothetical protein
MHARFFHDDSGVFLEDLGSANGTFVDGQKIEGIFHLRSAQLIRLGQSRSDDPTILRFDAHPTQRDVGKTRPVNTLDDRASSGRDSSSSSRKKDQKDDEQDTDDELTQPSLEVPVVKLPSPVPLTTRPVRVVQPVPSRSIPRVAWIGVAALGLLLALLLYRGCRHGDPWRRVSLGPEPLEAGKTLLLTHLPPGFEHGLTLVVEGVDAEAVEVTGTEGRAIVPEQVALPPGDHAVTVVGHTDGVAVFSRSATFRKAPRIDNIKPTSAHLGQAIVLQGVSFTDEHQGAAPRLFVGSVEVKPESVDLHEVVFRIPKVTEEAPVDLPVRVTVGGLDALAPSPLKVLSNQFLPLDIELTARPQTESGLWEIASAVGPILYLHSPSDLDGKSTGDETETRTAKATPPEAALEAIRGLQKLFERSRTETPRVQVRSVRQGYVFEIAGAEGGDAEFLFSLSKQDIEELGHRRPTSAAPSLRANWLAHLLTDVFGTLAGGRPPSTGPSDAAHLAPLRRLVRSNLDRGGTGQPGEPDLEALPAADRQALELAFVSLPSSLEPLTGRWIGRLENVFDPGSSTQLEVTLDLEQEGLRLRGTARAVFRSRAGTQGFREARATGTVTDTIPPRVNLQMSFDRPLEGLVLDGEVGSEGMAGPFSTSLSSTGVWQAARY